MSSASARAAASGTVEMLGQVSNLVTRLQK
jgi:hypothetical protein